MEDSDATDVEGPPLVLPGSIEGGDDPVLIGSECTECGNVTFPKRTFCPECLSDDVAPTKLPTSGRLESYTVVRSGGQDGFETPYAFGFIDLPAVDVRLYSLLDDWAPSDDLEVGMTVELVFDDIKDDPITGERLHGHKFRPSGSDRA
jgi:uncharacterized OB-fold protein